jgi:NADPH:quinone reductase-like Zn-dependent oxidoreductase
VAGIVEETGQGVSKFKKGDRVVIDSPSYKVKESKYGGWQNYVVGKQATTAKIADRTSFEDAAAIPYALLTAVAGLQLKLGMEKPGANKKGKVLIWGASGSVGGYAVQYAKSVGSPISKEELLIRR